MQKKLLLPILQGNKKVSNSKLAVYETFHKFRVINHTPLDIWHFGVNKLCQ